MSGPEITLTQPLDTETPNRTEEAYDVAADGSGAHKTWSLQRAEYDSAYWELRGCIDGIQSLDTKIYIRVTDSKGSHTYEAFTVTNNETDYGYLLYLSENKLPQEEVLLEILTETDGAWQLTESEIVDVGLSDTESDE